MSDKDEIYSDAQIESLIKNIFDGDTTPDDLPESLYFAIADYLKKALYKGFGGTLEDFDGKPLELLTKLRENIYMFSSAKTFQQTLEMSDALTDSDNNIRTFSQFRKAAADIYAKYNGGNFLQDDEKAGYLRTEYNTAIAGGQMAERWTQIESQADDLPYLQMSVVEDANTSEICEPLDGITLPINDPFWDEYYPPNHFNCFVPTTQILTPGGWKSISDIKVNDLVVGGSGKNHKVTSIHINAFNGEMRRIGIENNSITSTKNHRFLTLQGWKCAERIGVNDIIIDLIKQPVNNKFICAINNSYTMLTYFFMSIVRKWKSSISYKFYCNFMNGEIQVNKFTSYQFITNTFKSLANKIVIGNLLVIRKLFVMLAMQLRMCIIGCNSFFIGLFSNVNIEHGVINLHSLTSIGTLTPQGGIKSFPDFGKFFRSSKFSFFGINPLRFNGIATAPWFKSIFFKPFHNGSIGNAPHSTDSTKCHHIHEIHGIEGFSDGAPLTGFNSLFQFLFYSCFHNKFVLCEKNEMVNYSGQIYNLSVDIDNSYITNVGIVHNCRSSVLQLGEDAKLSTDKEVNKAKEHADEDMTAMFKNNVGKTGEVFNENHGYFIVPKEYAKLAERNFDLPIPETDEE